MIPRATSIAAAVATPGIRGYLLTVIERSIDDFPERIPAPPDLIERASGLARTYSANCFWFWHPEASIRYLDDVRLVVRHLREYGGWKEWKAAQELQQCLSHLSNARS